MLQNYLKLALRVMGRKKFFSFITLFGISFTLGILMVFLSFLQSEFGKNSPLSKKDDMVIVDMLKLQRVFYDTLTTVDTVVLQGIEQYDTTYDYKRTGSWEWNSSMNHQIGESFLSDLNSAERATVFSSGTTHDVYVNGVKLQIDAMYADPNYFEIFDHKFIEGRPFDQNELESGAQVVVITDKIAKSYFGKDKGVVDLEMEIEGKNYKVIGMIPHIGKIISFVSPQIVIPYTNLKLENQDTYYHGYFSVILERKSGVDTERVKKEVEHAASLVPLDHPSKPEGYNEVVFYPMTFNEMYAQGIYWDQDASKSLKIMKWVLFSLLILFILLPTLNLINLNVSRILERSAEIGVRKAFGAGQKNIIIQFIIENIVQTIIGGVLGLLLAIVLIQTLNSGGYLGDAQLMLNPKFFIYSFIATLIFGVLSGLLPAYRMSKLKIVNALKENKL